jgi:hypothetical protein
LSAFWRRSISRWQRFCSACHWFVVEGDHLHVGMYKNTKANVAIVLASVVVFAVCLRLVRRQETVSDVAYIKAMIPHHSIAIMTSDRAHIRDPRVRKLADGILEAQFREIGEMKALIADLERNPPPDGAPDLPPALHRRPVKLAASKLGAKHHA